jgi:hypothetical protein
VWYVLSIRLAASSYNRAGKKRGLGARWQRLDAGWQAAGARACRDTGAGLGGQEPGIKIYYRRRQCKGPRRPGPSRGMTYLNPAIPGQKSYAVASPLLADLRLFFFRTWVIYKPRLLSRPKTNSGGRAPLAHGRLVSKHRAYVMAKGTRVHSRHTQQTTQPKKGAHRGY